MFASTLFTYWALTHRTDVSCSISAQFIRTLAAVFSSRLSQAVTVSFFCFRVAEEAVLDLVGFSKVNNSIAPLRLLVSFSHTFCMYALWLMLLLQTAL